MNMSKCKSTKIFKYITAGAIVLAVVITIALLFLLYREKNSAIEQEKDTQAIPGNLIEEKTPDAGSVESKKLVSSKGKEKGEEKNLTQEEYNAIRKGKKYDAQKTIERKRAQSIQPAAPSIAYEDLSPEDQALFDKIDAAYEADNLEEAIKLSAEVRENGSKTVREQMIFALGWFGEKAIEELLPYLADPDDEVADWALSNWNSALAEVESQNDKIKIVETVMKSLTNKEFLEDVSMEYLDVDDRIAIESIIRVVNEATNEGAAQAKEMYSMITGRDYTTEQEARQWMEDFAPDTTKE